jgi:3-oxoacid CoA-transferase subunit A/glutaconate CoA-transferase subunit A
MAHLYTSDEQMDRLVDFKGAREYHLKKDRRKKDKRMPLKEVHR